MLELYDWKRHAVGVITSWSAGAFICEQECTLTIHFLMVAINP